MAKRCRIKGCKQHAEYAWQPTVAGVRETFYRLGFHIRGYSVIPVCDDCRKKIIDGKPTEFRWKGIDWWIQDWDGGTGLVNTSMMVYS